MSFDVGFQRGILRLAQIDESFSHKAMNLVDSTFFTTEPLGWCFTTMKRYQDTYSMRCTELPLRDALRYAPAESITTYAREIDSLAALGNVPEAEYIKAELREFVRRNIFATAHAQSARLWNEKKHDDAYRVMREAEANIERVKFEEEDRSWFFEDFDERQKKRFRETMSVADNTFTTGIPELDNVCDGGARLGEVWLMLGEAKVGKTTWLCNQGFNIIRVHKQPVLHCQLEGMRKETEAKYDALFSNELHAKVRRGEFDGRIMRELLDEYARLKELLVIRAFTDWDVNILHIQAELRSLRAMRGFKPKGLILDYVDLMRSRTPSRDNSETKHQIDATRDLKRLTMVEELATHTASQLQRPKTSQETEERILRASSVADAYAKIRIVDWIGSLNATDEERKANILRLFSEFHRSHPMNRLYTLTNDFDRMRIARTSVATPMRKPRDDDAPMPVKKRGKR